MTSRRMRRRYLLKAGGVVGLTGVAGFSGAAFLGESGGSDDSPAGDPTISGTTSDATNDSSSEQSRDQSDQQNPQEASSGFQIDRVEAPAEVELGEEFTTTISVSNTGTADGRFSSTVTVTEDDIYAEEIPVELPVPAGETRSLEWTESIPYLATREYELGDQQAQWSVDITKRIEPVGTPVTVGNRRVSVESLTEKGAKQETTSGVVLEAGKDKKWVFATISATNTGDGTAPLPLAPGFSLLANQAQYTDDQFEPSVHTFEPSYEGGLVQPGIQREGIVPFEIPSDLRTENLIILWYDADADGETVVEWHQENTRR